MYAKTHSYKTIALYQNGRVKLSEVCFQFRFKAGQTSTISVFKREFVPQSRSCLPNALAPQLLVDGGTSSRWCVADLKDLLGVYWWISACRYCGAMLIGHFKTKSSTFNFGNNENALRGLTLCLVICQIKEYKVRYKLSSTYIPENLSQKAKSSKAGKQQMTPNCLAPRPMVFEIHKIPQNQNWRMTLD